MKLQKFAVVTNQKLKVYNKAGWKVVQVIGIRSYTPGEGHVCHVLLEKEEEEQ